MTIEHSTISFGEIHPVANWAVTVGGVAALGGIPVGDGDIGKVAWVAGVGHYVLASTSPTVWESLGVTITGMTYDIPSETLSITLSDGTTHSVVIAVLDASEVNTLISDALDDYDTAIKTYIGESITSALGALTTADVPDSLDRRYVSDAQLSVLGNTSGTNSGDETTASIKTKLGAASAEQDGYVTSADWSTFNGKEPAITNGTASQYVRGDKTLAALNADAVAETESRVFLSPEQKTVATQAASSSQSGYLSSTDWSTFNGKQAALADVITANTYGSSTEWPKVTVNAKGIVTGVTLQTVPTPTLTDATFSVQKNGSPSIAASWDLTALTSSRVHTYPNKAIDFKTLSSIGASDGNVLSGTRNRILGGSGNGVSGTDVVAIDCVDSNFSGNAGVIFKACYNSGNTLYAMAFPRGTVVNGTSQYPKIVMLDNQSFYGGAVSTTLGLCTVALSANGSTHNITADTNVPSSTNSAKLVSPQNETAYGAAVHDVDFVVMFGVNDPISPIRTFYAKRRVYAANHYSTGFTSSVEVVGTDTNLGSVAGTVTIGFTIDTTNNRLVPTISATGSQAYQVSCRINSHYNRKA